MASFSSHLSKPLDEIKKPPPMPAGAYPAVIKTMEFGDANKNKTPYLRLQLGFLGWPEEMDRSDHPQDFDLSKKTLRKDFYLSEDAQWRLAEFIKAVGISTQGKTLESAIPELIGKRVTAMVEQYMNQQSGEIGNQIGEVLGGH